MKQIIIAAILGVVSNFVLRLMVMFKMFMTLVV